MLFINKIFKITKILEERWWNTFWINRFWFFIFKKHNIVIHYFIISKWIAEPFHNLNVWVFGRDFDNVPIANPCTLQKFILENPFQSLQIQFGLTSFGILYAISILFIVEFLTIPFEPIIWWIFWHSLLVTVIYLNKDPSN